MKSHRKIIFNLFRLPYLVWLGLFSSMTNLVYLSAIPSLFSYPYFLFRVLKKEDRRNSIKKIHIYLLLLFIYIFLSGGIYNFPQFFTYSFYRYDGNIFVSYAVFFLVFLLKFNQDKTRQFFFFFICTITILNTIYFFSKTDLFGEFLSFFSSTSAAGGFLSLMTGFAFFFFKKKYQIIFIVFLFFFLFMTSSRGGLLALVLGVLCTMCSRHTKKTTRVISVVLFLGSALIFFIIIYFSNYNFKSKFIDYYKKKLTNSRILILSKSETSDMPRIKFYWPKALIGISKSPVFGNGFGSYNEFEYICIDREINQEKMFKWNFSLTSFYTNNCAELVGIKRGKINLNNREHAHNSYLHFLFELGIVGLLLVGLLWFEIYNLIIQFAGPFKDSLLCGFWILLFSSFVENRLTAPATIIPFSLLFLVCISSKNRDKTSI